MSDLHAQPMIALKLDPLADRADAFAADVLNAYMCAEQMRTFNRLLLRRLAVLALGWLVAGRFLLSFHWTALLVGLGMLVAGAAWGVVSEYRATKILRTLLMR